VRASRRAESRSGTSTAPRDALWRGIVVKDGKAQAEQPNTTHASADETPISTSGIVPREEHARDASAAARARRHRRRDSHPPRYRALTPYQARLDVEMDDTAVSKVRDPSVSISLDPKKSRLVRLASLLRGSRREAVVSTAVGLVFGTLLVAALAALVRACS